jgi:hypothetical protein
MWDFNFSQWWRFQLWFPELWHTEDGGSMILWNTGIIPQHYTSSQHKSLWLKSLSRDYMDDLCFWKQLQIVITLWLWCQSRLSHIVSFSLNTDGFSLFWYLNSFYHKILKGNKGYPLPSFLWYVLHYMLHVQLMMAAHCNELQTTFKFHILALKENCHNTYHR